MSSFVLLSKHGVPDLVVEVGTPITKDPVLLSGLFQAIVSFTDEVTQAPLQVIQTKGFTVQFEKLEGDYILMLGSNHTITGLDSVMNQIGGIIEDAFRNNIDNVLVETTIKEVLTNYVEFAGETDEFSSDVMDKIPDNLLFMLENIPDNIYRILFFGILSGYDFRYPKTNSMDLNRNFVKAVEFFEQSCCTDLDPNCNYKIGFSSRGDKFTINDHEFLTRKQIKDTVILRELISLVGEKKFMELRIKLISENTTLDQLEHSFLNSDLSSEIDRSKIDDLRYLIGHDLEYYLFLRLQRKDPELVKYLQAHTKQTEWMSQW